jgi:tyrosine-protein kinase
VARVTAGDHLRVVIKRRWVVILVVVLFVVGTVGLSLATQPEYQASTRLYYKSSNLDLLTLGLKLFSNTTADREVQTGALLVPEVADSVIKDLGLSVSRDQLLRDIDVRAFTNTDIIDVRATNQDPTLAAKIADSFAEELITYRNNLEQAKAESVRVVVQQQLDSVPPIDADSDYAAQLRGTLAALQRLKSMPISGFTILSSASVPTSPVSPRTARNAVLALILGIVAGVGVAFLVEYTATRGAKAKPQEEDPGIDLQ